VELSLIAIMVFSMVIALIDFGQFLFIHQALTERARSAVRYGLTASPLNTTEVRNMVLYGTPSAGTYPYMGLTSSMVQVSTTGGNTYDYRLTVKITNYPFKVFTPAIAGSVIGRDIVASLPFGTPYE
jgi:hypothetical protein